MRRARTFLVAAAVGTVLVGTVSSPAHAAAPPKFSYSTTGTTADAFFSDAPADGNFVPRTTYHDVFVTAGQSATRSDGTTTRGSFAYFDEFSYSVDRRGNFVFEGERFGFAEGVSFTADKKLTAAALSAALEIYDCDEHFDCVEDGTQQLDLSWTGYGETTRVKGSFTVHDGNLHYTERQDGYFRQAQVSGLGTALGASLFTGKSSGRCMGEGCFF